MEIPLKALLIEDSDDDALLILRELRRYGYQVTFRRVETAEAMSAALEDRGWDVVLADYALSHFDAVAALKLLQQSRLDVPFIILSGAVAEEDAVFALKAGAHDFITKRNMARLGPAIERERQDARERRACRQAEAKIRRQLARFRALHDVAVATGASLDPRLTMNVVLSQITMQLEVDAADILLIEPRSQQLTYTAGHGFRSNAIAKSQPRLGHGYASRVMLARQTVRVSNLREVDDFQRAALLANENFITYFGVPLVAKGQVKGILEVFHRAPIDPDPEWLQFLEALATHTAIAIDNADLFQKAQHTNSVLSLAYDATLEGWARALDVRDCHSDDHTLRVTDVTLQIAREFGIRSDEIAHIRRGALLHNIGKMKVPESVLHKPGPLNDEEWAIMRRHPMYAYELLAPIPFLKAALDIPYCHQERWNGSGYPRGLVGSAIPLAACIFTVVDVWDTLLSERPYRAAWTEEQALGYIKSLSGTDFAPQVVQAFLPIAKELGR